MLIHYPPSRCKPSLHSHLTIVQQSIKYEDVPNPDSSVSYGMRVKHYTDDTRTTLDFTMTVEYIVPPSVHLNKSCGDVLKETHAKVLSFIDFLNSL